MSRKWWMWFGVGVSLFFSGCNLLDKLPVIGIDQLGNPAQVAVPQSEYIKRFVALTTSVQDSAIPVLNQRDFQLNQQRIVRNKWLLRSIEFGIGINAEIGIGPFKVGAFPNFRIEFTNCTNPPLPS